METRNKETLKKVMSTRQKMKVTKTELKMENQVLQPRTTPFFNQKGTIGQQKYYLKLKFLSEGGYCTTNLDQGMHS